MMSSATLATPVGLLTVMSSGAAITRVAWRSTARSDSDSGHDPVLMAALQQLRANPVPIIVPCHRVVASDGLGGYSGGNDGDGLSTKRHLLEFEWALPTALF